MIGILGTAVDVTERHQVEQERERFAHEAREYTQELEALFAAITEGIFVYDATGALQRTNPAARALLARYIHTEDLLLPVQQRASQPLGENLLFVSPSRLQVDFPISQPGVQPFSLSPTSRLLILLLKLSTLGTYGTSFHPFFHSFGWRQAI